MGRLDGKVAIVTGGARGQGEAEIRLFAAEGAKVVGADLLDEQGAKIAESLGDGVARFEHLDVTDEDNWQAVVASTEATFGPVSVLVNNAGILAFNSLTRTPVEEWRTMLDVNLTGAFLGIKSVVRSMTAAGGGSIINISSTGGMEGLPMLAAYSASKWGMRGLSRSAAVELGKKGIRVNSVHPGGIDTPMTQFPSSRKPKAGAFDRQPIGRVGTVDDVAPLVLFLASDEAGFITGGEYVVDGGHLAGETGLTDL